MSSVVKNIKSMRILIILLFISFSSFGQTKEIDELKQIWFDEMIEYGEIVTRDIYWDSVFVPFYGGDNDYRREQYENGMNLLLNNYPKNKEVVKNKMVEFFGVLGNTDQITIEYRKKLFFSASDWNTFMIDSIWSVLIHYL